MNAKASKENILMDSLLNGTAVSLLVKHFQSPILTVVLGMDPAHSSQRKISIPPLTLYGNPVDKTEISFDEIESVTRLHVPYDHPVYARVRKIKAKLGGKAK